MVLKVIFAIKESVVKILSPLLQKYLDLQDIILFTNKNRQIVAAYRHDPELIIHVNWSECNGFIISLATMFESDAST